MADIIPLAPRLAAQRLTEAVSRLNEIARSRSIPEPEALGWVPTHHDEAGRVLRWLHPGYRAMIGYVPGSPELVWLDYRHEIRAYELDAGALALGLDTGVLPDPVSTLDWKGDPIE